MINIQPGQGNSISNKQAGRLTDWNLTGCPLIILLGPVNKSHLEGSTSNSLKADDLIPARSSLYVFGPSDTGLDREEFFHPDSNTASGLTLNLV